MSKATVEDIKRYFHTPNEQNRPEDYAITVERSKYLVRVIDRLFQNKKLRVLELGSNVGRNLYYLQEAGHSVFGVEGSQTYFDAINDYFPEIRDTVQLGQIELVLPDLSQSYDLVFTMAVFEHIPPEIETLVFSSIQNLTDWLLTVEDEHCDTWNHFPRNYRDVFEKFGFSQVKAWTFPPLGRSFVMRLFRKEVPQE